MVYSETNVKPSFGTNRLAAVADMLTTLPDPAWRNAWNAVIPHLSPQDRVLLPAASWPPLAVASIRTYTSVIDIGDATVLFLHKGRIAGICPRVLRDVYYFWQPVFANDVFACFIRRRPHGWFSRTRRLNRVTRRAADYQPIREVLKARKFKTCKNTTFFIHIPKAAGTTVWEAIAPSVKAKLYIENYETVLRRPPRTRQFDLIGGHIPLPILAGMAHPGDCFAALLRDPVARFRSAFLHSRRPGEDIETFTPGMRLMRERPLTEFLSSSDALLEICQQSVMLGFAFDKAFEPGLQQDIFTCARAAVEDARNMIFTTRHTPQFIDTLRGRLGLTPLGTMPIPRNTADAELQARDIEEFQAALPSILGMMTMEQELYDIALRREAR